VFTRRACIEGNDQRDNNASEDVAASPNMVQAAAAMHSFQFLSFAGLRSIGAQTIFALHKIILEPAFRDATGNPKSSKTGGLRGV